MKRLTLFAGHYGSGKTNIAVNYAFELKNMGLEVVIADLDIVNPYFRTKDSAAELEAAGIELLSSEFAGSNVDFPALPGSFYSLTDTKTKYGVYDIGGDDRGAYALGRYRDAILEENNYEFLFVINKFRPLSSTAELTIGIMDEIESACKMKFTGIVNNSNLGELTTADDVLGSISYADEVSKLSGLPVVFTTVMESLGAELSGKIPDLKTLKLQNKIN